jgi:DNA repair protein RecO (recombination protein O)
VHAASTTAIVLRTHAFGESDKIVTLLTRDAGKLKGIARGAKRSLRRFGGSLELFSHVRVDLRERRTAELAFLERAVLLHPWRRLLTSLERYAAASHVIEVADKLTVEREVGDRLYSVVVASLARLDRAEPGPLTLRLFELAALAACGYRYDFASCAACRRVWTGGPPARAYLGEGGVLCSSCVGPAGPAIALSGRAIEELARLASLATAAVPLEGGRRSESGDLYDGEPSGAPIAASVDGEIGRALGVLMVPCLRSRLRSLELLGPILRR